MAALQRWCALAGAATSAAATDSFIDLEQALLTEGECGEECSLSLRQLRAGTERRAQTALVPIEAAPGHTQAYALEQCYAVSGNKLSVSYTCDAGEFKQKLFTNGDCSGPSSHDLGGTSPWHFLSAVWTCAEGAACASAYQASGAQSCVTHVQGTDEDNTLVLAETTAEVQATSVAVGALQNGAVDGLSNPQTATYATDQCYEVMGGKFSVFYTCDADDSSFTQKMFAGQSCNGAVLSTMGGPSPWHFLSSVWSCKEGVEACAGAWLAPGATHCVTSKRGGSSASLAQEEQAESQELMTSSAVGITTLSLSDAPDGYRHTFAVDACYTTGDELFSLMYVCADGKFEQRAFTGGDCGGKIVSTLGGSSPWHIGQAKWTCLDGAEACADSDEEGATRCAVGELEETEETAPEVAPELAQLGEEDVVSRFSKMYALQHCYHVGDKSFKVTCQEAETNEMVFNQAIYENTDCSGDPAKVEGGDSPWQNGDDEVTWKCTKGVQACADLVEANADAGCAMLGAASEEVAVRSLV